MIVAANTYKKKITAAKSEQNMGNPSYGQQNHMMQQSQHMPPKHHQQPNMQPHPQSLHAQLNRQQQAMNSPQQQQQLSPMSQHLQNEVGDDVVRSLDKLLASSSIGDKARFLHIPDRIPLPPQYESSLSTQSMPPSVSKLHTEYTNGNSTQVSSKSRLSTICKQDFHWIQNDNIS